MPSLVMLLGRGEVPADGVADYCGNLATALKPFGVETNIERLDWSGEGWLGALKKLWGSTRRDGNPTFVLQYTALSWSKKGFPMGAAAAMAILRMRGARCGVMFHEPWRQGVIKPRFIDRIRGKLQDWTILAIHGMSSLCIFSLPLEQISWLDPHDPKSFFIPLGPNVVEILDGPYPPARPAGQPEKIVCVFCLSEPTSESRELGDIVTAARAAQDAGAKLRMVFVGRGTDTGAEAITQAFAGLGIETVALGLRGPHDIARTIVASDVLLCVRGPLNLRRGSALAGLATGTPMVAYSGGEEGTTLMEAGVEFAPLYDQAQLGSALARVLTDDALAQRMHEKNIEVEQKYFAWDTVARQYLRALNRDDA
jgi:glycosyltransferase involved in cell wall biosynthesis